MTQSTTQKQLTNGKMSDEFGNRMKMYEKLQQQRFTPLLPICVRLDGKSFHTWTNNLERPFDQRMINIMQNVTETLVKETGACIGYTQSDEISLIFYSDEIKRQVFFDGKIQKIISILAARTSVLFNWHANAIIPENANKQAVFDCRAWQVPNRTETANVILWRELDATKNSISMAARTVYSHNDLINRNGKMMQDMLMEKGINWNDYPVFFKRGSFFQKKKIKSKFTSDELSALPEKHEARINPDIEIERTKICMVDMPIFSSVINREDVIFQGAIPITKKE